MSVITSKSSVLSIYKTASCFSRSILTSNKFQVPKNVRSILNEFKCGINSSTYEDLVVSMRDKEINDDDLLVLLTEAKNCTSLLNYDLRLFVQALLLIEWSHRGDNVVKCYQEFAHDLVSAHSCHVKVVVDQLVKMFSCIEEIDCAGVNLSEQAIKKFKNIHILLQTTLETVPMSDDILINSLKMNFPYFNCAGFKLVSYISNILKIIQYQPDLKINILQIAIDKLITMDINCPREEILQYENSTDLLYEMDIDGGEQTDNERMKHPIANNLDLGMSLILEYIKNYCYQDGKFVKTRCKELYNDLIIIFENVILPTYKCHHVQYIMFYICSFDSNLANDFLKFLWKSALLPSVSPIIRQSAIGYVSSFLARADYLPLGYIKNYLIKFSDWIHAYITHHDAASDIHKQHIVFYSICQAMFYLIAFRHQDLVNSSIKLVFLQSLNLTKIISCRLNPLKFCLPTIVDNFAAVMRAYQLTYCYTIIENNSRESLPLIGRGGQFIVNSAVDMCFPFDPNILFRVSVFINPLYKEYQSTIKHEILNVCGKKRRLCSGTEDEDDFIKDEIPPFGNGNSP